MSEPCYVEFTVEDEARFRALEAIVEELRRHKNAGTLEPGPNWRALFDERALKHFWWPTPVEREEWLRRWQSTPPSGRWTDPALQTPWDFDSLIEAFGNGEYQLLGIRRVADSARLEFEPEAFPYGGVGCMEALIEAFDFRVTKIADGSGPPYRPQSARQQ